MNPDHWAGFELINYPRGYRPKYHPNPAIELVRYIKVIRSSIAKFKPQEKWKVKVYKLNIIYLKRKLRQQIIYLFKT